MNSGKMPSPQTAWDSIATIQSKDAFDQAFQLYKSGFFFFFFRNFFFFF